MVDSRTGTGRAYSAIALAVLLVVAAAAFVVGRADARSPEPSVVDWPMEHRDRFHSGTSTSQIGTRVVPEATWTVPAKASGSHVIADGKVVFWGLDDSVSAVDSATGDYIWVSPKTRVPTLGYRGHAIAGNTIHTIDYDRGYIRRLSDGALLKEWFPGTPNWFSPTVSHGFLLSTDLGGCWVMGRDVNSFNIVPAWATRVPAECTNGPGVAVNGDVGYIGNGAGYLTAVRVTNGTRLFDTKLRDFPYVSGSPLIDSNGDVVLGVWDGISTAELAHHWVTNALARGARYSEKGDVVSVDGQSGAINWDAKTEARLDAAPIEVNGAIVAVDRAGIVYGFDRDSGTKLWQWTPSDWTPLPAPHAVWANQTMLASGNNVYVPHPDGSVYTLDGATGRMISQLPLPGRPMFLATEDSSNKLFVWYVSPDQNPASIGQEGFLAAFETTSANSAPNAVVGEDVVVDEGGVAQLDGSQSDDPDGDPLSFEWKRTASTGNAAVLTSTSSSTTGFDALDDGENTISLTVSDEAGESSSAEVKVTTRNVAPAVDAADGQAQTDGATVLSATFSDPGVLDRHRATVDWGDGTPAEQIQVTQGAGWGSALGAHRYVNAGTYTATVTVEDDDGGSASATANMTIARGSAAIWATSTSWLLPPFIWSGLSGKINGLAHSNADFKILGLNNKFLGGVEYSRNLWNLGIGTTISPAATKVSPSQSPVQYALNDYKPGGKAAVRAGSNFFNKSSSCFLGAWTIVDVHKRFKPGVYYAPCDIVIAGAHLSGNVTFVTPGDILVKGTRVDFQAYQDGLLFLAGSDSNDAVVFAGTHSNLAGSTFTSGGRVSITGSDLKFTCSVVANRLYVTGSNVELSASDCSGGSAKAAALASVSPNPSLRVTNDRAVATPGDEVAVTTSVSNTGATLVASGLMGAENVGTATSTAAHLAYELQYQSATDGTWRTLAAGSRTADGFTPAEAPPSVGGAAVTTQPIQWPGVNYPTGGDNFIGTTSAPGAQATWAYQSRVSLTPAQIELLHDPARVRGLRSAVHLEFSPEGSATREFFRAGADFLAKLRAQTPDLQNVEVDLSRHRSDLVRFSSANVPDFARLEPGETASATSTFPVPLVLGRGASETSQSYLSRLKAENNSALRSSARGYAVGALGRTYIPRQSASVSLGLPILGVDVDAPDSLASGTSIPLGIDIANGGSVTAEEIAVDTALDLQSPTAVPDAPSEIAAGETVELETPVSIPQSVFGTFTTRGSVGWSDSNGNAYGPVDDSDETVVSPPAALSATKVASLAVDADSDGDPTPGDTLEYVVTVRNSSAGAAADARFTDDVDAETSLLRESVETTAGVVEDPVPEQPRRLAIGLGTINGGQTVTIKFRVLVNAALPPAVSTVTNQGAVQATGIAAQPTDDPTRPGAADPTRTYVNPDGPRLRVTLKDSLTDADSSGSATVNDTIQFVAVIRNIGHAEATGVRFKFHGGDHVDLIGGSLTTSAGKIWDGSRFADLLADVEPGTIRPNGSVTIRFSTRVVSAVPPDVDYISNQADITSNERGAQKSDDPDTAAPNDPTRTKARDFAAMNLTKTATPAVDVDGNGVITAGDIIEYTLTVSNSSDSELDGVEITDPLPAQLTIVPGTAMTTQGTIESGDAAADREVGVAVGSLAAGTSASAKFRARVVAPLALADAQISNQATATANDTPARLSDDPGTAAPNDPTITTVLPAPYFEVSAAHSLSVDADGNGVVSPGDTVRLDATILNAGSATGTNAIVDHAMGTGLTLVAGSVSTTAGVIVTGNATGATAISINHGSLAPGSSAAVSYLAVVSPSLPPGLKSVKVASTARAAQSSARSIDPSHTIPVTRTSGPPPAISASKQASLAVDADNSGAASPGDTLSYTVRLFNSGAGSANNVAFDDVPGVYTELVAGSVEASSGSSVRTGNGPSDGVVSVVSDRLDAGTELVISFQVQITEAFPAGVSFVSNQGSVTSDELDTVLTIDPSGSAPGGATRTSVTPPPRVNPVVSITSPTAGSSVTKLTDVEALIDAPVGQRIAGWCLKLRGAADAEAETIECGDGEHSGEIAKLDATSLVNGAYTLSLEATATGGGTASDEVDLAVDGNLKLGRYTAAYQDMYVPVHSLPIQVLRTYDSHDKSKGDFGIGWDLSIANFSLETNGELGKGGWTAQPSGCTVVFGTSICLSKQFKRLKPHFVTVRWPDGRQEVFDFAPNAGADIYYDASAAFTGRAGATSTLEVEGDSYIQYMSDGNIYDGDLNGYYNPKRFRLTAKDGTEYLIDKDAGLLSANDRHGNSITVDESGIHSSTGKSVEFERDGEGRITGISGPTNERVDYAYSAAGDLESVTDARSNTMRFTYDSEHNLAVTKDPQNRPIRTVTYDDDGRMTAITDGAGNTTQIETDVDGRQQVVTSPDGRLNTVSTFDARGNLLRADDIADATSRRTEYAYDENDNMIRSVDPLGRVNQSSFDASGNQLSQTDPLGRTTRFEYGTDGLLSRTVNHLGLVEEALTRNSDGDVTVVQGPQGSTSIEYDGIGRITEMTRPDGQSSTITYNDSGVPSSISDGHGSLVQISHDASNRPVEYTDPAGTQTKKFYDANGNPIRTVDGFGNSIASTFDALGRMTSQTDQVGRTQSLEYDADGRLVRRVDRAGLAVDFTFDDSGRLLERSSGGESTTYAYDPFGRLIQAENDAAATVLDYDQTGQVVRVATRPSPGESGPDVVAEYEYDEAGRLARERFDSRVSNYEYDATDRLSAISESRIGRFAFQHDSSDRLTGISRPNGVSTSISFGSDRLVESILHVRGAATLDQAEYGYDPLGRRTTETDSTGQHAYSYDSMSGLTSADHPGTTHDETYAYDDLRNRVGAEHDAANRIVENAGTTYEHDSNGRLIERVEPGGDRTEFRWDSEGRLVEVIPPTGAPTRYKYDAFGRRIEKSRGSQSVRYGYGISSDALATYDETNSLTARFAFRPGIDQPLAMERDGQTYFHHQDAISSVTSLTNAAGSVVERYDYGAFGQPRSSSTVGNPYSFTGREWDSESSTYYYRARQYDPSIGRFISEDPIAATNSYVYAGNSPRQMTDPTGMYQLSEQNATISIGQQLVGAATVGIGLALLGDLQVPGVRNQSGHRFAFHYTFSENRRSILTNGIRAGLNGVVYVTPEGEYTPEMAEQLLALPPSSLGFRDAVIGVNLVAYSATGRVVPPPTVVRSQPQWERTGGGLEIRIPGNVDPPFLFDYR